jgi:hypothetical protein
MKTTATLHAEQAQLAAILLAQTHRNNDYNDLRVEDKLQDHFCIKIDENPHVQREDFKTSSIG